MRINFARGLLLVSLFVMPGLVCLGQDRYQVDNSHTSVVFAISHFGLSYTYGRFNQVGGEFVWNPNAPETSRFKFLIEATSVDTNDKVRDQHLRGPEFFNVEEHPQIRFVTEKIEVKDKTYQLKGKMTMLGVTKELTIPLRLVGTGKGPFGRERAGFFGKFVLKRSEFGMDRMASAIGDNVSVTFSFEGIKQ